MTAKFMFKLLTEEEREKVMSEYRVRRAVITLLALSLVFVVGIIGLLPSYVLSNARQIEVLERTRIMNSVGERGDELELQSWLADFNRKLQVLSPALDKDRPSEFLERVLAERVSGIRITGFSWVRVKDKLALSVDGIALDRQALIEFQNRFKSSEDFSEVTFPISNLAKDRDIDFQIKFSLVSSTPPVQTP